MARHGRQRPGPDRAPLRRRQPVRRHQSLISATGCDRTLPGLQLTDARRIGFEAEGHILFDHGLFLSATASWVHADNRTDDRALAQIPPLEGRLVGGWTSGRWSITTVLRWADRQTRVDDDPSTGSGLDFGQTPGWTVFDLWASVDIGQNLSLQAGLANAFDRTYALHLNRSNLFDPNPIQVNEPGQSIWARLRWHSGT